MRIAQVLFLIGVLALAIVGQDGSADRGKDTVKVQAIHVKGSRLSERSILYLTGLHVGEIIDEAKLRQALQNASASGLFNNIAYRYESAPGSTDATLELTIDDERPLVPATVNIEEIDSEKVWQYLAQIDPLFTRELPRTEGAIRLYEQNINKYLESIGRTNTLASGTVTGAPPSAIVFEAVKAPATAR